MADSNGSNPGNGPVKQFSLWDAIGGFFLIFYGGEILRLGAQAANLFAGGVAFTAASLATFLNGFWVRRQAIQSRAGIDAAVWLGMLVLAAAMGSIGMGMDADGPANLGKLVGGAILGWGLAFTAYRLYRLGRARLVSPDWATFWLAYPWAERVRDIVLGPAAIVIGPVVGLVVWAIMPSDPLAFRTVASNAARIIAILGTLYAAFRLAGALALVNVAAYWATATVSLVQEPLGWLFKVVQGMLVKGGAVEVTNGVPRIIDTAKVGEVLKSIQLNLVMVFLLISALTIAAPSITLLGALVTILILIAAYVANAGAAGFVIEWGYKIIAKVLLFYIASTAFSAILKFAFPDSFGWLLYAPGYADARLYAVLSHGVVQSAIDLVDGVWAVEAYGLLPSGEFAVAAADHAMSIADRISVGLVYVGLAVVAVTLALLKLAILRAKFEKKSDIVAASAAAAAAPGAECAAPVAVASAQSPSWIYPILGGLLALALLGGLGYGGYRVVKGIGSPSTANAPATTTTVAPPPPAPPATATATGGTNPPPVRTASRGPTKPATTASNGSGCSQYPKTTNAYKRCVELAEVRASNRYSDE